jgi:hypothetical protein
LIWIARSAASTLGFDGAGGTGAGVTVLSAFVQSPSLVAVSAATSQVYAVPLVSPSTTVELSGEAGWVVATGSPPLSAVQRTR